MIHIQLFIEGQQVELFKDESVTLTQTLQDVRDIEKIFADYSRTFNVPASRNNNKLFKHFYNPNIDGFDARSKKDAELYLNYKLFKKGKIKLEGTALKNNKGQTYRLTFFGNTVNIKDLLGDDKLSVLPFLSDQQLQFDYNATNIINYLQDGIDVYLGEEIEDAIIVPLITHTDRLYYKSSEDTTGTFNLAVGTANKGVLYDQLKPAIRIYAIIKAIEHFYSKDNFPNRVSQSVKFSTDFFNKTNERFYNLYMWLHKKKGGVIEDDEPSVARFRNFVHTGNSVPQTGLGLSSDGLSLGTIPQSTNYKLKLQVNTTSTDYNVTVFRNGEVFFNAEGLSGNQTVIQFDDFDDIGSGTFLFEVSSTTPTSYTLTGDLKRVRFDGDTTAIQFVGTATVSNEINFIASKQVPDITVLEFLTGLFKMFNLTAYYDDYTGEIQVLPLDDFYDSSTTTYDITEYLDKTSSQIDSLLPFKEIDFEYKGVDSFFAADHLQRFYKDWGTAKVNLGDKFDGQKYSVTVPFEHHKFERLYDGGTATTVQWGWSVNKDQESHIGQPLLFYAVNSTGNNISVLETTSSKQSISNYYIPSNSIRVTDSADINFSSENNEYAGVSFGKTLFKDFYKNYIEQTFDVKRRLSRFKAYLPLRVLFNLELKDSIIIFDTVYTINKITTNFETGLSDLELINKSTNLQVKENASSNARTIDRSVVTIDNTDVTIDTSVLTI